MEKKHYYIVLFVVLSACLVINTIDWYQLKEEEKAFEEDIRKVFQLSPSGENIREYVKVYRKEVNYEDIWRSDVPILFLIDADLASKPSAVRKEIEKIIQKFPVDFAPKNIGFSQQYLMDDFLAGTITGNNLEYLKAGVGTEYMKIFTILSKLKQHIVCYDNKSVLMKHCISVNKVDKRALLVHDDIVTNTFLYQRMNKQENLRSINVAYLSAYGDDDEFTDDFIKELRSEIRDLGIEQEYFMLKAKPGLQGKFDYYIHIPVQ